MCEQARCVICRFVAFAGDVDSHQRGGVAYCQAKHDCLDNMLFNRELSSSCFLQPSNCRGVIVVDGQVFAGEAGHCAQSQKQKEDASCFQVVDV